MPRPAGATQKLINILKHDPRFIVTGGGHNMAVESAAASTTNNNSTNGADAPMRVVTGGGNTMAVGSAAASPSGALARPGGVHSPPMNPTPGPVNPTPVPVNPTGRAHHGAHHRGATVLHFAPLNHNPVQAAAALPAYPRRPGDEEPQPEKVHHHHQQQHQHQQQQQNVGNEESTVPATHAPFLALDFEKVPSLLQRGGSQTCCAFVREAASSGPLFALC